jgi:hypothetical protein
MFNGSSLRFLACSQLRLPCTVPRVPWSVPYALSRALPELPRTATMPCRNRFAPSRNPICYPYLPTPFRLSGCCGRFATVAVGLRLVFLFVAFYCGLVLRCFDSFRFYSLGEYGRYSSPEIIFSMFPVLPSAYVTLTGAISSLVLRSYWPSRQVTSSTFAWR